MAASPGLESFDSISLSFPPPPLSRTCPRHRFATGHRGQAAGDAWVQPITPEFIVQSLIDNKADVNILNQEGIEASRYAFDNPKLEGTWTMLNLLEVSGWGPWIYNYSSNHSYRQTKRLKTKPYPIELKKTGAALLFMVLNFCATTISLALTHERIPDKAPLPDFLLDNIQTRSWGLTASEIVLQVSQWIKQHLVLAFKKQWWFKIESIFNI